MAEDSSVADSWQRLTDGTRFEDEHDLVVANLEVQKDGWMDGWMDVVPGI
jgi:hypothetical protein